MSISKLAFHSLEIIFLNTQKKSQVFKEFFLFLSGVNFTSVSDILDITSWDVLLRKDISCIKIRT